jgi:predicted N-formylglutamate amidohydrolase
MNVAMDQILAADEPPSYTIVNEHGTSPFFLTCDHAGRRLPRLLGSLGLSAAELEHHIAWDIGAAGVAQRLAAAFDAFLILQTYSRLVIDCNRAPGAATSIATLSELTTVPGNLEVSGVEATARAREIFEPYHQSITRALDARRYAGRATVLVAVHSFTPAFKGIARPWHIGILYNRDPRFGRVMLEVLRAEAELTIGDNEPYAISDETDYTIPNHGERRGIPHVEIEIRQDLIATEAGQASWAARLVRVLGESYQRLMREVR